MSTIAKQRRGYYAAGNRLSKTAVQAGKHPLPPAFKCADVIKATEQDGLTMGEDK